MPRNFEPMQRDEFMHKLEGLDFVADTARLGEGVLSIRDQLDEGPCTFSEMVEETGWYVAMFEKCEGGDRIAFMPVTEVPE